MSTVSVEARVIAAGSGKGDNVLLTIALMPVKIPQGQNNDIYPVSMAEWPEKIHDLMKKVGANSRVRLGLIAASTEKPVPAEADRDANDFLSYAADTIELEVKALWQEIAESAWAGRKDGNGTPFDPKFWDALATVFAAPDPTAAVPRYMIKPAGVSDALPNVAPTCRSDAAIAHLLERAERLVQRIVSPAAKPTPAAALDPTDIKEWDKEEATSDSPAAKEKLKTAYDNAIAAEQKKTADDAEEYVGKNQTYLTELRKFLEVGGTRNETAVETLSGYPVGDLFKKDERQKALAQARTLHLAALLPDVQVSPNQRPLGAGKSKAQDLEDADRKRGNGTLAPLEEDADNVARTFVTAIRSSPMLARLFRFVVDVEVPREKLKLDSSFKRDPEAMWEKKPEDYAYAYLGAGPTLTGKVDCSKLMLTLAKATRVTEGNRSVLTGFWPVTREEVELRRQGKNLSEMRTCGAISQVNGVFDLAQAAKPNDPKYNPRFDIITIDPIHAMETSARNERKNLSLKESARRLGPELKSPRTPFHHEQEPGLVTRGLVVVDRWRAESVAREIMTAELARTSQAWKRVLDADDLTVGYHFDVAVKVGERDTASWRSLMEREIDYRKRGHENDSNDPFRLWFRRLGANLEFELDRRRNYDAGMMMPSARRRILPKPAADAPNLEMIHAEEMIATWEGDPLGLNCHSDKVKIRDGTDLAISRLYNLPSEDDEGERKAWPLRYGWAYRFGVRPVWLGGVSLPLVGPKAPGRNGLQLIRGEAVLRYDDTSIGVRALTLPAALIKGANNKAVAKGWRRLLRHEPILPPVALLPRGVAEESSQLAPQTGVRVVLRTLNIQEKWKKKYGDFEDREKASTWRIILPPRVSLDQAVRHGVFDEDGKKVEGVEVAPGDLLEVNYDSAIDKERAKKKVHPDDPDGQTRGFPAIKYVNPENPDAPPAFEDFFDVHSKPVAATSRTSVANQYYADPMADQLVVAIRPNTDAPGAGYFGGDRRIFRVLNQSGSRVKPVALQIERLDVEREESQVPLRQRDFWFGNNRDGYVNGKDIENNRSSGRMFATVSTLRLAPGEAVDVDCWFVPSIAKLRAFFDWPETLAVKAAAETEAEGVALDDQNFRKTAIEKLPLSLGKKVDEQPALKGAIQDVLKLYKDVEAWVGLGGKIADPAVIAAAAEILHRHMLSYPIPEIAAIRTIEIVHAVARPPRAPEFLPRGSQDTTPPIQVLRVPSTDQEQLDALNGSAMAEPYGKRGYDGIAFAGFVKMDRDSCRQLEILAHCVSPARAALDDVRLGRTELQRLLGEWPERVIPVDDQAADGEKHAAGTFRRSQRAHFLFGFDVDARGKVFLPKQWVTLLRLDDLGEEASVDNFSKTETIDLLKEQKETLNRRIKVQEPDGQHPEGTIRAASGDHYSDRLARKITIMLRVTSRFDQHFIKMLPRENSDAPLPETQFPPDPDASNELITRTSYEGVTRDPFFNAGDEQKDKQLCTLWIPSTIVPAKPEIHALLPSYVIARTAREGESTDPVRQRADPAKHWVFSRRPQVRILLDRPWYSSGEGEQLGIVLWPPRLHEITNMPEGGDRLKAGKIPRAVLHKFEGDPHTDLMDLSDFDDADLGPGGKFTTRWGGDPIRNNDGPVGPFLPAGALSSFDKMPEPGREPPGYVPSIAIPLEDLREREKKVPLQQQAPRQPQQQQAAQQQNEDEKAYETLTASLATFVPRFDVESEKWFVDVAFNADTLVEPFVRFGLVRYQQHAAEGLRVSAPVVSWAQVLPGRTVDVRAWRSKKGAVLLKVNVNGRTSGRSRTDAGGDQDLVYPKMRISVVELGETAAGLPRENIARARLKGEDVPAVHWAVLSTPTEIDPQNSPGTWKAGFVLPQSDNYQAQEKGNEIRRFAVIVEEIEEFLSTADENAAPPSPLAPTHVATPNIPPPAPMPEPAPVAQGQVLVKGNERALPIDIVPIKGDKIDSGFSRRGPRFLARIEIEVDKTLAIDTEAVLSQ